MNQVTFATMLKDGNTAIDILQSVQEDKRFLMRALADAFMDGMIAQERLAAQPQTGQDSA